MDYGLGSVYNTIHQYKEVVIMKSEKELQGLRNQLVRVNQSIEELRCEAASLNGSIRRAEESIKKGRWEISDADAPRSGHRWSSFELEDFREKFAEFILCQAKIKGCSTLAIKYKAAEYLVPFIPHLDWLSMERGK